MKSSFIPYKERLNFIYTIVKPGYQAVRDNLLSFKNIPGNYEEAVHKL
jgi:adenosine deaminase